MTVALFDTVLVANRGEIARRVIRTLRTLGIRSVAVYSDADAGAPHVREADRAVRIGPAAAAESYLSIPALLAAARESGARAVHPGYGFLSENVAFARACADEGLVFIGPGIRALEVMGDKIRAKEHVAAHGVPVVPGFSAIGMDDAALARAAVDTGFPLLVKPSAGGGGKGMQIVRAADELATAVETARRVARSAFGNDTLLVERLVERPRHIEVQVLADEAGNIIHLGERECTLQRRHQKVIEEAPSAVVDAATRELLGKAACAAAASVDYRGAGTVEFLVAGDRTEDFFFIEMNTRLQVEHPVTEIVTGVDLVEQQIRIAAGEELTLRQPDVGIRGHAIEARVYAETPARGFLPATGDVLEWRPAPGVRTDAAVETGSVVTSDYDPMMAKVIASGDDRDAALSALDAALADTVILGLDTNIAFLRSLLQDPEVRAGRIDTALIDRLPTPSSVPATPAILRAAAGVLPDGRARHADAAHASALWRSGSGWRAGGPRPARTVSFLDDDDAVHEVGLEGGEDERIPGLGPAAVDSDGAVWVHARSGAQRLRPLTRREATFVGLARTGRAANASSPEVGAPMPGAVTAVHVAHGDPVEAGERIVTIEAMKMEHPVLAPHAGTVHLKVAVGDQVRRDQTIAIVRNAHEAAPAD
ncbi:biotin carboxylase N-terminal domain-containing protein [Microbacterium sp. NPDC077184]|uniref:acetyl/propionyl/methylcrotonyl-CoA carboxylase subunit alpha n=1 Tax=Microbacterium sp. NPDC077184 TaxID=3154764 RepID=UPI0034302CD5